MAEGNDTEARTIMFRPPRNVMRIDVTFDVATEPSESRMFFRNLKQEDFSKTTKDFLKKQCSIYGKEAIKLLINETWDNTNRFIDPDLSPRDPLEKLVKFFGKAEVAETLQTIEESDFPPESPRKLLKKLVRVYGKPKVAQVLDTVRDVESFEEEFESDDIEVPDAVQEKIRDLTSVFGNLLLEQVIDEKDEETPVPTEEELSMYDEETPTAFHLDSYQVDFTKFQPHLLTMCSFSAVTLKPPGPGEDEETPSDMNIEL